MLYNHNKPPPTSIFNHDNSNIHINGMHWPWARVMYMQVKSRRRNNVWNFMVSLCFSADKQRTNQNFAGRKCTWIQMSHLDCWESSRALVLHLNHQRLISNPAHSCWDSGLWKHQEECLTCKRNSPAGTRGPPESQTLLWLSLHWWCLNTLMCA